MDAGLVTENERDLPLAGRSIVVTRSAEQAPGLIDPLEALGAEVIVMPVIAVVEPESWQPVDDAIEHIGEYDWIVLTSVNGVERFEDRMRLRGMRLSELWAARVAVVGSATAKRVRSHGIEPAVVPVSFRAEGLLAEMRRIGPEAGRRVLIPRAAEAREVLPDELRELGFEVDVVPVYRLETPEPPPDVLARLARGDADAVVFASGGTARRFVEVLHAAGLDETAVLAHTAVASIGPVTTAVLRELGIDVAIEAAESTASALVTALAECLTGGASR